MRLVAITEGTGAGLFTTTQAVDQGAELGLTAGHIRTLFHALAARGWLTRVKRGLYAINGPVTKLPKAHPFAIATPSAVSHWSALQRRGLIEQVPATVMLSSPTQTFPPPNEADGLDLRPVWIAAGVRYDFVAITRPRFFGVTRVSVDERNRVPIFDQGGALLDAFHHFRIFGSLSAALGIIESDLAEVTFRAR